MIKDYFKIPAKEIRRRKLRSWLTLIGIFIGIAAIVSLITLGQGLENAIEKQFSALGKDKLFILPKGGFFGMGSSELLTEDDLELVQGTSGVKIATGLTQGFAKSEFNDLVHYGFISGISTDPEERALVWDAQTYGMAEGRLLRKGDKFKTILGYEYSLPNLFDKRVELGDKILLHNKEFKVVGFLEKIGSPPDDQAAIIPLDAYEEVFDSNNELNFIIAQTKLAEDPFLVAEDIEEELRDDHRLDEGEEDFEIQTPEQFAETFGVILDIVQIVLIGIAGIALLVGGIGIMNTMFTAVLQRTKEIGIMKAIGARNSHILYLFLVESGLYGILGGLIGVTLGIGFAKLTEFAFVQAVGPAFLVITIDWVLIIGTLIFSFLIGVLSGIAPARRASKLNPVDSLRYE
ncbi:ABC transporter permease [Candidatus Woesearchaeota archaeon]|jgi:putative ABC transport system permease protein|nr:ABC transporter permease [Candidatus Woesearchaeota archaeon]MBT4110246.1 ABC transporter permease [Candidatus Woesearchaeota archaeon]MBT4336230.1 ABC transporter permease [Candidatus Woesearchaeota archaeon]MBT4468791.1 ABC transporter permease [Candidatus Woesearchaeota archaeon]MBT6744890.1 ABC transporter permease [Candidatus Woesearchaeota archaeon]